MPPLQSQQTTPQRLSITKAVALTAASVGVVSEWVVNRFQLKDASKWINVSRTDQLLLLYFTYGLYVSLHYTQAYFIILSHLHQICFAKP